MQGRLYKELGSRAERDYRGALFAEGGEKKDDRSRVRRRTAGAEPAGEGGVAWTAAV